MAQTGLPIAEERNRERMREREEASIASTNVFLSALAFVKLCCDPCSPLGTYQISTLFSVSDYNKFDKFSNELASVYTLQLA